MSGLLVAEVHLPKTSHETSALFGARSRVRWVRADCVLRTSARISARCDTLAHAGARNQVVTYPWSTPELGFLAPPCAYWGWGPPVGVPVLHGPGLFSTPYAEATRARLAQTKCEVLCWKLVSWRPQSLGIVGWGGRQPVEHSPVSPAVMRANTWL